MTQAVEGDFNPSFHFLGLIQKAMADGVTRRCTLTGGPEVYIVPQDNLYYTAAPNIEALESLCSAAPFDLTIDTLPDWHPGTGANTMQIGRVRMRQQTASAHANLSSYPLSALLWYATLCVSRGQLLRGCRSDEPVRLRRCPDFSALHHRKAYLTLAAFMVEETADLATVSKNTGVPLGQVFNFHNACAVLGLIERGRHYNPQDYLPGIIQDAIADQRTRRCVLPGHPPLFIVPSEGRYHFEGSTLAALCSASNQEFKIDIVDGIPGENQRVQIGRMWLNRKPSVDTSGPARPLSDLMFAAVVGSSLGRRVADGRDTVPVKLNRWPDPFCLEQDHRFFPLSMYMLANTATLESVATSTSIPLAKVVDFHNACAALGLIDYPQREAAKARRFKSDQNIKLVFTGSVGAGKTTAISLLNEIAPIMAEAKPTDEVGFHKGSTTVSMDYGELTLKDGPRLKLYGTPGQRRFAFMCNVLSKGALGMIVLVNNILPDPLEELNHFLTLNADFLKHQPAVIGVTHLDLAEGPDIGVYQDFLAERGANWPVMPADARRRDDMLILIDNLLAKIEA